MRTTKLKKRKMMTNDQARPHESLQMKSDSWSDAELVTAGKDAGRLMAERLSDHQRFFLLIAEDTASLRRAATALAQGRCKDFDIQDQKFHHAYVDAFCATNISRFRFRASNPATRQELPTGYFQIVAYHLNHTTKTSISRDLLITNDPDDHVRYGEILAEYGLGCLVLTNSDIVENHVPLTTNVTPEHVHAACDEAQEAFRAERLRRPGVIHKIISPEQLLELARKGAIQ